jgi:hypothetical protein
MADNFPETIEKWALKHGYNLKDARKRSWLEARYNLARSLHELKQALSRSIKGN